MICRVWVSGGLVVYLVRGYAVLDVVRIGWN
jgi:hypothetical protein